MKFLRERTLCERLGIHRVTLRRWIAAGRFPRQVKLGPGTVAWRLEEVETWEAERTAERGAA
jgi:prophage regulatory protein